MGLGIPPLEIKIVLESNPLKSTMLVGRLAVLWISSGSLMSVGRSAFLMRALMMTPEPWIDPHRLARDQQQMISRCWRITGCFVAHRVELVSSKHGLMMLPPFMSSQFCSALFHGMLKAGVRFVSAAFLTKKAWAHIYIYIYIYIYI